jgi:hypothetical protein
MRSILLKTYFCRVLLLLILTPTAIVQAGEKIEERMQVPATGHLFINNDRGYVEVLGWNETEILVRGELGHDSQKLVFMNKGEKTFIKIKMKESAHRGDTYSSDGNRLEVFVPKDILLHFKGIDTDFTLTGLDAGVKGTTINGELLIKKVHSGIDISSISGDIEVSGSSGTARIESVQGDINLKGEFEDVYLQSVAGDIQVDISNIGKLQVQNVGGDTLVVGHLIKNADVYLSSVNGGIHYQTEGILNAQCEISSQFGGDINNHLTDDLPNRSLMQQQQLKFVSGDGSATLVMKTITGDVKIDKTH